MNEARHDIATASTMLERARQVLELTHREWRLHERPLGRRRLAKAGKPQERGLHAGPHYAMRAYG